MHRRANTYTRTQRTTDTRSRASTARMLRLTRNMSILPASRTHRHWNTGCPKSFKMVVVVFICPHWKHGICAHTTSGNRSCGQDEGMTGRRPLRRAQCSAAARPPLSGCCSTFHRLALAEASPPGLPAPPIDGSTKNNNKKKFSSHSLSRWTGTWPGHRTDCNGETGDLTAGITSAISAMSIQLARAV